MEAALNFLSRRALTEKKMGERLSASGFSPADIQETLNRLVGWGYLNDYEFGKNRVEHLLGKLKSRAFVKGDLLANGLEMEAVQELMTLHYPESLEIEIAQKLLRRKSHDKRQNKTWGFTFLMRSGFSENTIHRCFPEVSST